MMKSGRNLLGISAKEEVFNHLVDEIHAKTLTIENANGLEELTAD